MARSLNSQEDIRRALAYVFREAEHDRMAPPKARVLGYAALSISQILTETDLEARILALETAASQRRTA